MQTGWVYVGGKYYYMNKDGVMQTGWQPISEKWYYFNADGSMKTGWMQSGSVWYYFQSDGSMATSDIEIDGKTNRFDSNGVWKGVVKTDKKIKAYGIDVSSHQGDINWSKVKKDDIDFAMIRIMKGKTSNLTVDDKFKKNYKEARAAGVKVGVYQYSYITTRSSARANADAVIDALNGKKLDYPVVLDLEDSSIINATSGKSKSYRSEMVLNYKKVIEASGYKFALYTNIEWMNKYLDMDMLKDVDIWVARWRNLDKGHGYTGKGNVTMWQYSNTGSVAGISGNVDLNVSYKNY